MSNDFLLSIQSIFLYFRLDIKNMLQIINVWFFEFRILVSALYRGYAIFLLTFLIILMRSMNTKLLTIYNNFYNNFHINN